MVSLIHGGEPKVMPASDFWTTSPTYAQREAVAPSQGGLAALQCRIKDDGALERCIVFGEGPAGAGLGEAALRLAPLYRARLELDGRPTVGAVVFLDFNFFKPSQPPSSPTGQ
jgi:protein TonB